MLKQSYLIFRTNLIYAGLAVSSIYEIVHIPEMIKPPGIPGLIEGYINFSGKIVPSVYFHKLFQLSGFRLSLYTPVIIMKTHGMTLGLIVEELMGVISPGREEISSFNKTDFLNEVSLGECVYDGKDVSILDPRKMLLEKETRKMEELAAMEQQRLGSWDEEGL